MNFWLAIAWGVVAAYLAAAFFTAGSLWEREVVLNPDGERGPKWAGALVVSSLFWFVVVPLWPRSRPVPSPQPDDRVVGDRTDPDMTFAGPPRWRELLPEDESSMYRGPYFIPAGDKMAWVEKPTTLAVMSLFQPGDRVFVKSMGLVFVRGEMNWAVEGCACRYNFSGFPVVVCHTHRSDVDPHGEPDESEGDVGR